MPHVTNLLAEYGLIILFAVVAIESMGVPVPGETALILAAIRAQQGHYSLVAVIAVAALAAMIGDNVGYWIGRKGGRGLLERTPLIRDYFRRALPPAERFFARHGAKAVFFGRFVAVLRVTAAWIAGISRMPWWRFLMWNSLGAIVWATVVAGVAYKFGQAAADAIAQYGIYGAIGVAVVVVAGFVGHRIWRRRLEST